MPGAETGSGTAGKAALAARLTSGATRLARCWWIARTDGVRLGLTDHDRDIHFDDRWFRASPGLDPGTLEAGLGLGVDNGAVLGALRDAALDEADILAGRYDGATVEQWLVDWSEPTLRRLLFAGTIGEIRRANGAFQAELRGLSEALNRPVGRAFLPTCDRILGDDACGVALDDPALSIEVAVYLPESRRGVRLRGLDRFQPDWFAAGTALWLDGPNAGVRSVIRTDRQDGEYRILGFWQELSAEIGRGDRVRLIAGCDKRATTCSGKFGNILNFRGFPDLPGEDWVTAYPREGGVHDGASRTR